MGKRHTLQRVSLYNGMPKKLLDISRIKLMGWCPKKSLKDGIKDSYEWYLKQ